MTHTRRALKYGMSLCIIPFNLEHKMKKENNKRKHFVFLESLGKQTREEDADVAVSSDAALYPQGTRGPTKLVEGKWIVCFWLICNTSHKNGAKPPGQTVRVTML